MILIPHTTVKVGINKCLIWKDLIFIWDKQNTDSENLFSLSTY